MHRVDELPVWSRAASLCGVVCTLVVVWGTPGEAQAQKSCVDTLSSSEKDTFDVFLSAGRSAFDKARYDKALMSFEQAYYICPMPKLLFLIGECHEALDHASEAIEYYQKFLDEDANTDRREEVEARVARLETLKETTLTVKTLPEGAKVLIDGQFQGISPQTIVVARARIELSVELEGHRPITQQIELDAGVQKELFFTMSPERQDNGRAGGVAPRLSGRQRGGVALWIAGGVAMVGGTTLASVGVTQRRELEAIDRSTRTRGDYNTRYEAANRRVSVGVGALAVGAVLVGAGTYLFLGERDEQPGRDDLVQIELHMMPGEGGALGVMFDF